MQNYECHEGRLTGIKSWTRSVSVEEGALRQLYNLAALPFIFRHIAVMPDVHFGIGDLKCDEFYEDELEAIR